VSLYSVALFLHITGTLGVFAGLALDWAALSALRRATTVDQVREWISVYPLLQRIGPASVGLLLIFGLYMTVTAWGPTAWISLGFFSLIAIAVLGAVSGVRLGRAAPSIVARSGTLSADARAALRRPLFVWSLGLRVALALAVVFLMTVKPETPAALAVVGGALVLGALAAATTSRSEAVRLAPTPGR
jgi:hypothetical protein